MSGARYETQKVKAVYANVTGSRALGAIYQNTTGRPMVMCVDVGLVRDNAAFAYAFAVVYLDNVTPPLKSGGTVALQFMANVPEKIIAQLTFIVPPKWYYKVDEVALFGSVSLLTWLEYEL